MSLDICGSAAQGIATLHTSPVFHSQNQQNKGDILHALAKYQILEFPYVVLFWAGVGIKHLFKAYIRDTNTSYAGSFPFEAASTPSSQPQHAKRTWTNTNNTNDGILFESCRDKRHKVNWQVSRFRATTRICEESKLATSVKWHRRPGIRQCASGGRKWLVSWVGEIERLEVDRKVPGISPGLKLEACYCKQSAQNYSFTTAFAGCFRVFGGFRHAVSFSWFLRPFSALPEPRSWPGRHGTSPASAGIQVVASLDWVGDQRTLKVTLKVDFYYNSKHQCFIVFLYCLDVCWLCLLLFGT